ncbi:MAG TPA: YkvA family protein [Prolixibacteraceae bacterium]|jgi:uncharacterized membrane protein YkvA (DUF1232 family)
MENYGQYSKFYSEESFWKKLKGFAGKAGVKVVYSALLLYYMLVDEAVDLKSKVTIVAALGYFILPFDIIPDLLPVIGFTDDLSVLMFTLSVVKAKINETHRVKARNTMEQWFQGINDLQIFAIEEEDGR